MNVESWVGVTGSVLAIITMAVGALLYINGSYNRARMMALREDNSDLRLRVDDQDKEIAILKERETAHDVQIQHLEQENETLIAMVTQKAEVGELMALLDTHHQQSMELIEEILSIVKEVLNAKR